METRFSEKYQVLNGSISIFTRLSHTYQKYRREFSGQTNHQEIALMKQEK